MRATGRPTRHCGACRTPAAENSSVHPFEGVRPRPGATTTPWSWRTAPATPLREASTPAAPRTWTRARGVPGRNLYLNRKITGAIVGRQPFGGFKISGMGSKAGGPDYLLQFLEPRTVTENTLRRGFAPDEDLGRL